MHTFHRNCFTLDAVISNKYVVGIGVAVILNLVFTHSLTDVLLCAGLSWALVYFRLLPPEGSWSLLELTVNLSVIIITWAGIYGLLGPWLSHNITSAACCAIVGTILALAFCSPYDID